MMQFINFPPRKIGQKVVVQSALPESSDPGNNAVTDETDETCIDCSRPLGNEESMVRNNGKLSHLEPCQSDLVVHAEDAKLAAGRSWPALKESKTFDSQRLAISPLFERKLFQ